MRVDYQWFCTTVVIKCCQSIFVSKDILAVYLVQWCNYLAGRIGFKWIKCARWIVYLINYRRSNTYAASKISYSHTGAPTGRSRTRSHSCVACNGGSTSVSARWRTGTVVAGCPSCAGHRRFPSQSAEQSASSHDQETSEQSDATQTASRPARARSPENGEPGLIMFEWRHLLNKLIQLCLITCPLQIELRDSNFKSVAYI